MWAPGRADAKLPGGGGWHQAWSVPISCSPAVQLRLGHPTCLSSSLLSNEPGGFSDLKGKGTQEVGLAQQDQVRGWGHPPSPTSPGAPSLLSHAKAHLASRGLYHRRLLQVLQFPVLGGWACSHLHLDSSSATKLCIPSNWSFKAQLEMLGQTKDNKTR